MENKYFYQVLNSEFDSIIKEKQSKEEFQKKSKDPVHLKSYAFMVWFLQFYGKGFYGNGNAIVDGPGDSSCDIIFSKENFQKEMIYYVVQSKWNKEEKCNSILDSGEVKKALDDFQTILDQKRMETQNERFNKRLEELSLHIRRNGKVEFIFLSLCKWNEEAKDNIKAFHKRNPNMHVRIFDIEYIKKDYIEVKYKKLEEQNLLERKYNPKEEEISIPIERLGTNNNQIIVSKPFEAGIFLVRPSIFYQLFEKYGYSLFIENVRNPIKKSEINKKMQETLQKNPAFFYYYNNGITAITNFLPTVSKQSQEFNVRGLQIINGAQTVNAIHTVYSELGEQGRKDLDDKVLILLRVYVSGGEEFDRNVTKYTNAQNPMDDRDFWANDPIQIRLQNESFQTKYWYERRKDEFRDVPEGITVLSNKYMAGAYVAFVLNLPFFTQKAFKEMATEKYDTLFISKKVDDHFGMYEYIFNEDTRYLDLLISYLIFLEVDDFLKNDEYYSNRKLAILGLFKPIFEKYLILKYHDIVNCVDYLWKKITEKKYAEIDKTIRFIQNYFSNHYGIEEINQDSFLNQEIQKLKVLLPAQMKLEDIESINLEIENK